MQISIEMAHAAKAKGEVPIGAVIVKDNIILAKAGNASIQDNDPSAHAEIKAIRVAAEKIKNYRILDTTLYVTLEPCCMCAGAIIQARIARVVFGAFDPKAGACGSVFNIFQSTQINHRPLLQSGVLADQCGALLTDFFKTKRQMRKCYDTSC